MYLSLPLLDAVVGTSTITKMNVARQRLNKVPFPGLACSRTFLRYFLQHICSSGLNVNLASATAPTPDGNSKTELL